MIVTVEPALILNANARDHWASKARLTALLRTRAALAWERAGKPTHPRARLVVTVGYPDRRRRDVANLAPTIKALIDGMVHPRPGVVGVLPDDDDRHLTGPDLRVGAYTTGVFTFAFDWQGIA